MTAISESKIFYKGLEQKNKNLLEALFLDLTKTSKNVMQLRYLDLKGNEIIRIERESMGISPQIITQQKLQNKADRYYFKETLKLEKGKFWYSKLDLNVEHGKVEMPPKPVLRMGTPLYYNGKRIGLLVINIFMKNLLQSLTHTSLYNIILIDKEGNILVESSHKLCWSKYLDKNVPERLFYLDYLAQILKNDTFVGENFYAQTLTLNNGENLKIIVAPSSSSLKEKLEENSTELLLVFLMVVLLSLPLSYFMSSSPARLKEEVDKLNENLKAESREKDILLSLFDLSSSVLFKWNNDANWSVSTVSKSVTALMGYAKEEFENNEVVYSKCIHHEDLSRVIKEVGDAIDEEKYFFKHEPYRIITKSGAVKWILDQTVIVRDEKNDIISFVGYLLDITEIKERENELQILARTDQLTQINNRVHLDEVLYSQYYRFRRNKEDCSVIILDIDFFKEVNDKYGHIVGDEVLMKFAKILVASVREGDIVGRWGGEEFLVILPHTKKESAMILAEKLRKIIENVDFGTVGKKTASFGVCSFNEDMSTEKIIDMADNALYAAKKCGRNCVKVCQE